MSDICRKQSSIPKAVLDDLPTWVKSLESMAAGTQENMATSSNDGEERVRKVCISCEVVNKDTTAEKYCIECSEYLCTACSRITHAVRKLTGHLVLDYNGEGENADKGVNAVLADYFACSKHPEKILSLVCEGHNKLCCTKCLLEDHKYCDDVTEIQDRANAPENETELNRLKGQFKTMSELIKVIKEFKQHNVTIQKLKVEEIRNQIAELRTKVNKIFDSLENEVSSQARALVKEIAIKTDEEVEQLEHIGKPLKLYNSLSEAVKTDGSDAHAFITFHTLRAGILNIKDKIVAMRSSANLELKLRFGELVNELVELNPEDIGELAWVETESVFTSPTNFPEDQECFVTKTITDAKGYEIRSTNAPKYQPTYSDVQYLSNNKLFLADCYQRNMCCLVDTQYALTSVVCPEKTPTRTTSLSNGKIALIFENEKTVHILSENMQTTGEISTKFTPKAICGLKNNRLAVAWCDPLAFGIVALQETVSKAKKISYKLKEITFFDHDKAQRHFKSFEYIAVDERRGRVIQPCTVDKAVFRFDFSGNPKFKYTHTELISPRGVACDSDGFIYVCENHNSGIHILSPDGVGIQIVNEGVHSPLAISVNNKNNELAAVTRYDSPWHKITVFQIRLINT